MLPGCLFDLLPRPKRLLRTTRAFYIAWDVVVAWMMLLTIPLVVVVQHS
jgi:hypothetical protein